MNKLQTWTLNLVLLLGISILIQPASAQASDFTDLKGHWSEEVVQTAVTQKLVQGYADGTFRPDHAVTRAEAASMLSRVTRLTETSQPGTSIADIDSHWSLAEVDKLTRLGLLSPADYAQGFQPDLPVTRFELMKWMTTGLAQADAGFRQALVDTAHTLLPSPESYRGGFTPEQIPYLAVARGAGLVNGFEDGSLRPNETASRAELAAILLRYERVEGTRAEDYLGLNELREVGLTGTNATSLTPYHYLKVPNSEEGRAIPKYIKLIGIGLSSKMDFDGLEPLAKLSDTGIYYNFHDETKPTRFVKLRDLNMTIREAVLEGLQRGDSMYLGPEHPKQMSTNDVKLYYENRYIHVTFDDELIPYTSFANVVDKPVAAGDLAVLTMHRMIIVDVPPAEEGAPRSLYADFLLGDREPWLKRGPDGLYVIFKEVTMKVHDKPLDMLQFYNAPGHARGNGFFTLNRIRPEAAARSGLLTIPESTRSFFAPGSANRFWAYNSMSRTATDSLIMNTDSGDSFWLFREN
ncbi:S-layer homology domain-containing protein [Paenibacillus planticolens]|uniref:SLH domain-containing protein n=1 Tax=Paenibacillus planticolens TaxID=2654976 RepID=A0ABX1ZN42_9BACL|nr:S-layer homology domain-containing protein [Paenibacillus planticolens]NOV01497.1 hypothetical protein [Paenibacillus planticolens]